MTEPTNAPTQIEQGTYELIRDRLVAQGKELAKLADSLNERRLGIFGGTELGVVGNVRIRTENNCIPRDIAQVGDRLLFGYNVFIGLKKQTEVADVFSAHRFNDTDGQFSLEALSDPADVNFLADAEFRDNFSEIYAYYKSARLLQLRNVEGALLAVFQTGATVFDLKVLRWALSPDGEATYRDNRGERDHTFAPAHDFEWTPTTRDQHVQGKNPHVDILGEVFVETVGGDLTVKVENNTEDGLGIYREPVDDHDQTLDDGEIHYAKLGTLILLKILPYRETEWRYLVFNTRTKSVDRVDAVGQACQQLPEDHGIIFPGGYTLRSGVTKTFDGETSDLEFVKRIRSPNGEDVLYVFHHREDGSSLLLPYNLIRKEVATPIACHGHCVFQDGKMMLFRSTSDEPTRVHSMQIWQTPFVSAEFAAKRLGTSSDAPGAKVLENIGNADLVRGVSDAYGLQHIIANQAPSVHSYEDLIAAAQRMTDNFHWLSDGEVGFGPVVQQITETAELVIDEFEKVTSIKSQTAKAIEQASSEIQELTKSIRPDSWNNAQDFVGALGALRMQRGHLISLRDLRYVDVEYLDQLEQQVIGAFDSLSAATVDFLQTDDAFDPYHRKAEESVAKVETIEKVTDADALAEEITETEQGLQLLSEIAGGLVIDDATVRAALLEQVSQAMAGINRSRALLTNKRKSLRSGEATAEFGAEFKLFGQTASSAISSAVTPEDCDAAMTRLMVALEDLESRYADFDDFLAQLQVKREESYEAVTSKRQRLLDEQQRRIGQMAGAADRILDSVRRRAQTFKETDELNAFFAGDAMVAKARDFADKLRGLGDSVKADELTSRIKTAQQEAIRALRDRKDIYEDGADVIRLGRHRFSVNTQDFELTLVPRDDAMALHLVGTDFYEPITDQAFLETNTYWDQTLASEDSTVYRAEYLATSILAAAETETGDLTLKDLQTAQVAGNLLELVRGIAAERYDEGYDRGVHDADAALILDALLQLSSTADLLRFPGDARALAFLFWQHGLERDQRDPLAKRAQSLVRLRRAFGPSSEVNVLLEELDQRLATFVDEQALNARFAHTSLRLASHYLVEELALDPVRFISSGTASGLVHAFEKRLRTAAEDRALEDSIEKLDSLDHRLQLVWAWLTGFAATVEPPPPASTILEAVVLFLGNRGSSSSSHRVERRESHTHTTASVPGLLGQHALITDGVLELRLDELIQRSEHFRETTVPGFRAYQQRRHQLLESETHRLRIDEFKPRVLSSFVRNQLLDEVYLPLIGDNLAKQIGTTGDGQRTDLMGLLLLISPPGYGKTTLMEYIANRLGLVFMKINGPSLGHSVTSLDPAEAPSATARQEIEKVNLAFEMANNVLLYIDDIQHTSSEFLQKFISLCDAQRRVEGVWNGRAQTYDLRGKKFAVCMAGNPYTESGERFEVPDMLANRADTYNLGDVLDGREEVFALSYIENSLTSNSVLAPLSGRDPQDVRKLVTMARGGDLRSDQLKHPYSAAELQEIRSVLDKLLRVQEVVLRVNQEYIYSSSQDDAFRTEPKFQLQGSYRNMNKLAEKILAVMNSEELEALLDDHYIGEAQTLTSGAEHNMLKLKEMRGTLTDKESARWQEILSGYARVKATGGADDDPITRVTSTLGLVSDRLGSIQASITAAAEATATTNIDDTSAEPARIELDLEPYLERLQTTIDSLAAAKAQASLQDPAQPVAATAGATNATFDPQVIKTIATQLGNLTNGLQGIGGAIEAAASRAATEQSGSQVQVVQTLSPGVYRLMADLSKTVDSSLMQLLRGISRWLKRSQSEPDPRIEDLVDRSLQSLDRFKDLVEALQKIETRGLVPPPPAPDEKA